MQNLNFFWILLTSLFLFLIDGTESVRFYRYNYYSYYSYTYYYYSGYTSSHSGGVIAGGVISGLVIISFISACCFYCCCYRGRRTSGAVITTPGTGVVYPATGTRVVYPVTTANSGVLNQPPPPYEPSQTGPQMYPSVLSMENVDSRSKTNLVHSEVPPQ